MTPYICVLTSAAHVLYVLDMIAERIHREHLKPATSTKTTMLCNRNDKLVHYSTYSM
jgi:hypothetical protein